MDFSEKMFVSDKIEDKDYIVKMIKRKIRVFDIYLVCIDRKGKNIFEIVSSHEIHKQIYKNKKYLVVAILLNKQESFEFVKSLICEYLDTKRELKNLKNYYVRYYT